MILTKLSFETKAQADTVLNSLAVDEVLPFRVIWEGQVPKPKEYDEDGNCTNEGEVYPDYAVDILSDTEIEELDDYIIEAKGKYRHSIAGFIGTVKTK